MILTIIAILTNMLLDVELTLKAVWLNKKKRGLGSPEVTGSTPTKF